MKIKVGIIGLGYWGPNYLRNFINHPQVDVTWVCDLSQEMLQKVIVPSTIRKTQYVEDLLTDKNLDAVAIATPPTTHFQIAKDFLEKNKHVFVAKPLTTNLLQARELSKIAQKKHLLLYTDLTYLHTKSVQFIHKFIHKGQIGQPLYYDSTRSNLGLIQKDVNVIWDLAPHDLGILDYCFGFTPKKVFATGSIHHGKKVEEMAHITITYTNNFIAHIHTSWISPVKFRTILIGGSRKMIYFNDVEQDEKIKIYDKQIDFSSLNITAFKPIYRSGDIVIPHISASEALSTEVHDFVRKVLKKEFDKENIQRNLQIIKLLEACDKSLKTGKPVTIT